jgi:hypothetical protein
LPADESILGWSGGTLVYGVRPQGAIPNRKLLPQRLVAVTPPARPVILPLHDALAVSVAGHLVTDLDYPRLDYADLDGTHAGSRVYPNYLNPVTGLPDGYLFAGYQTASRSMHLYDFKVADGSLDDWGSLPGTQNTPESVIGGADASGVVVAHSVKGHSQRLDYFSFAAGHFVRLDDAGVPYSIARITVGSSAAAWIARDKAGAEYVVRAPLTGAPATSYRVFDSHKDGVISSVVPLHDRTAWAARRNGGSYHVWTVATSGGVPAEWSQPLYGALPSDNPLGAVGDDLVVNLAGSAGRQHLKQIHTPGSGSGRIIASVDPSPISSAAVAIGPGRAAWSDNSRGALPVWTRSLSEGGSLSAGPAIELAHSSNPVGAISVSGRRTAYFGVGSESLYPTLLVSDGDNPPVELDKKVPAFAKPPVLSGTRLLYSSGLSGTTWSLVNLGSGAITPLPTAINGDYVEAYALWGDYLVYARLDGSVWRRDLTGAHPDVMIRPIGGRTASIATAGDYVAWYTVNCASPPGGKCSIEFAYRNAATLAPPVTVKEPPGVRDFRLTPTYLVFTTPSTTTAQIEAVNMTAGSTTPFTVTTGPAVDHYLGFESLSAVGSRVAWLSSSDGGAHVEALPHVAEQPRFLGNPIAASVFDRKRGASWDAEFLVSTALRSCSVTITQGTAAVRTLDCANSDGDALVHWDGTDTNGRPVPASRYQWTLTGANSDGALLNYDGSNTPITGSFRVTPARVVPTQVKAVHENRPVPATTLSATGPRDVKLMLIVGVVLVGVGTLLMILATGPRPSRQRPRRSPVVGAQGPAHVHLSGRGPARVGDRYCDRELRGPPLVELGQNRGAVSIDTRFSAHVTLRHRDVLDIRRGGERCHAIHEIHEVRQYDGTRRRLPEREQHAGVRTANMIVQVGPVGQVYDGSRR